MAAANDDGPRADVEADLRRVADRLRGAPEPRVRATASQAREVLQLLADSAAGVDARDAARPPASRPVPELLIGALGDQLAVLGADLLAAAHGTADQDETWLGSVRQPLGTTLIVVAAELRALRLAL